MPDSIPVDVIFENEDPRIVVNLLNNIGAAEVEEVKRSGFTGIEILVAAVIFKGLPSLIGDISRQFKKGVIVDARGKRIQLQKSDDLAKGDVLVIAPEGVRSQLHQPADADIGSLLKQILPHLLTLILPHSS